MVKDNSGSGFSLKDELFNRKKVNYLAKLFKDSDKSFDSSKFTRSVMRELNKLELKERIVHIATVLKDYLSSDYKLACKQISASLPQPLDPNKTDNDFGDFIFAPLGEYIVVNGVDDKKNLKLSLKTLKEITMRFSMEDAIRAYINKYPKETLAELTKWSKDKNYHVRRLVSEGTRPLLPWSSRLTLKVNEPLKFLDILHSDNTRYVTRSVANHLNDIAKTEPSLVISSLKDWKKRAKQDSKELNWMCRHALRTLVKQGNPNALKLLGYRSSPKITVSKVKLSSTKIKPGEKLEFSFSIEALRAEELMVDYVIDFVKANGKLSPKVHKLKSLSLSKGNKSLISKKHLFKADATTYKLYPGKHYISLQINGKSYAKQSFEILK